MSNIALTVLDTLYPKRFEHEDRARKRMLDSFDNDILKQQFEIGGLGKEHRIVLIGGSNVGKTTLILTLLGANTPDEDEEHNIISLARHVRGNTEEGGAGTSTVTRYRVSENNEGTLTLPRSTDPIPFNRIEELGDHLKEIRRSVESGVWDSYDPVLISLPKHYFKEQPETPWVITDLPGIGSTSTAEHKHVSELMKAWILQCNVFLVLTMANQINQLKSLEIPGIGSWQLFSRRCRLVITRSLTEHSMLEWLKKGDLLNTQELIEQYRKQLSGQGIDLDYVSGVFPLDYGHSWENLRNNHPDIYGKVAEAMSGVYGVLKDSLNQSLSPEEEYRVYVDLGHAEQIMDKKREKLTLKLNDVVERKTRYEREKNNALDNLKGLNKNIDDKHKELQNFLDEPIVPLPDPTQEIYDKLNGHDPNHPDGHYQKWNEFAEHFYDCLANYSEEHYEHREQLHWLCKEEFGDDFPPFSRNGWRVYTTNSFNESYKHTFMGNAGALTKPFGGNSKNERRDHAKNDHKNALRRGIESEMAIALYQVNIIVKKLKENEIERRNKELSKMQYFSQTLEQDINNNNKAIEDLRKQEESVMGLIQELNSSFSSDMNKFRNEYPKIRKEELNRSITEYIDYAKQCDTAGEKVQYLSFAHKIKQITLSIDGASYE